MTVIFLTCLLYYKKIQLCKIYGVKDMNQNQKMADLLLPHIKNEPQYYENIFPTRNLIDGAKVTRIAPSPTGYLHIGTLFVALINRLLAVSGEGVFYTRIEDTDKKREIEGGIENIVNSLNRFCINIDEGFINGANQTGKYGPYQQSLRAEIYQTYAKSLILQGLAYPCFCSAEDLAEVRKQQEYEKERTGYHGKWAKHRNISFDEAKSLINKNIPFVVRLKSPGNENNKVFFNDCIKGKIEMPENDEDFVILKSDGIPTYHFAHAVDDHLMRTTHIIRGDEWISSTPKHLQLFSLLGFKPPKYAHVAPIMKLDNGAKRKISKRKDPEAAVSFFIEQGFEPESIIEYLMTIGSSDFENWRKSNPNEDYQKFNFSLKKMSISGALFDWDKLCNVAKNVVVKFDSQQVVEKLLAWAKEFDNNFGQILNKDIEYAKKVFAIDRDCIKPRKDIYKWDMAKEYCSYFYDELHIPCYNLPEHISKKSAAKILGAYINLYDPTDDNSEWFKKIKDVCPIANFATDTKEFKENPEKFAGNPGDASTIIRIAITGRQNTPNLCEIMKTIGKDRCLDRINKMIQFLETEE